MLCWHYCLHCNDWFSRWTLVSCFPLIFIIHISWKRSCGDKWHSFLRTRQDGSCHQQLYQSTTTVLWPFFRDNPGEPVPEENFWTLWCKGILNRGKHTDHLAGRHSIRTNQWPTSLIPSIFTPDAFPAATLPIYPGLGQAPYPVAWFNAIIPMTY